MDQMTSPRTGQLLLYKTSERYLDRVTAQLQQKAGQEKKFRRYGSYLSVANFAWVACPSARKHCV